MCRCSPSHDTHAEGLVCADVYRHMIHVGFQLGMSPNTLSVLLFCFVIQWIPAFKILQIQNSHHRATSAAIPVASQSCTHSMYPLTYHPIACLTQASDDALTRKSTTFVARAAGAPPGIVPAAWATLLDLHELLNEFAVFLIEVPV